MQIQAASGAPVPGASCNAAIVDSVNGTPVFSYNPLFTVQAGTDFLADVSNITRFGDFTAKLVPATGKTVEVSINYFRDRGVFESGEFTAEVLLPASRDPQTISGRSISYVVSGTTTTYQTNYTLTCQRLN